MNDGGPAFPVPMVPCERTDGFIEVSYRGMTLHDYFAAAVLTGMCANPAYDDIPNTYMARHAYDCAKSMLTERKQRKGEQ